MGAPVEIRLLRHQHQIRAQALGVEHVHHVLDAVGFRLAGAGDHTGPRRSGKRHDADRAAAQTTVHLLLDAGEKAIKVQIEHLYFGWTAHRLANPK